MPSTNFSEWDGALATTRKAFISHLTDGREVAQKVASALEEDFHAVLQVFVPPERTEKLLLHT